MPPHTEVAGTPPWWALVFTLIADGTLFTSLVFGTLYLWIAATALAAGGSRPHTNLLLALGCVVRARRRRGARRAASLRTLAGERRAAGLDRR